MAATYLLNLNYEGTDYQVEVQDLATANLLLNDHQAANQYIESMLNSTGNVIVNNACSSQPTSETESQISSCEPESIQTGNDDIVWTRKKPTERDNEATSILLSQRQKMEQLFIDKKTRKSKLWNDIAKVLEQQTFRLGAKGGERCRQKFANLQKAYLSYIKHQKTTGTEKNDDIPPFFEELHSILGGKHKVNPTSLEDSMVDAEMVDNEIENNGDTQDQAQTESQTDDSGAHQVENQSSEKQNYQRTNTTPSTSRDYSDRFKKTVRKVTPTKLNELLKEIQEDRKTRSEEFSFLKKHLSKSESQRDRFIDILEHAFGMKKSRQREQESSESD